MRQRFVPVHDERGKLLFRYDPERDLVEIVQRGERTLIDLRDYQAGGRLAQANMTDGAGECNRAEGFKTLAGC